MNINFIFLSSKINEFQKIYFFIAFGYTTFVILPKK